jgi:hypothetical protein
VELSIEHAELGSDKVGRLVRNRGLRVSSERVRKVRREESLQVPPPKKKQSRRGISTGGFPKKAAHRGHVGPGTSFMTPRSREVLTAC